MFQVLLLSQIYKFFVELIPARDDDDDNDDYDEAAVPEDQEEDEVLRPQVRLLPPHVHNTHGTGSVKLKILCSQTYLQRPPLEPKISGGC